MKTKTAIKNAGHVLGVPQDRVNQVINLISDEMEIDRALKENDQLRRAYEGDPEIGEMIDYARDRK